MFFIVNDTKYFLKPECSVTQSSAVTHPYEWAIADVLSGKKISLVQWTLVMTKSEGGKRFCLI